ncbi:MAG TPA: ABC transporter substrate-binding protein, partial [Dehalococcoidia bacterium]
METNYWARRQLSRRSIIRGGAVALAGIGAAAVVGCGGGGSSNSGSSAKTTSGTGLPGVTSFKRGGIIKMGTPALSSSLDPHFAGTGYHKTRLAFDTPLDFDENGNPSVRPDALAASFEMIDKQTVVLKLKPGVKFHDGTAFNAEAIKWNVARELQPNPPAAPPHKSEIELTDRIEAVDDVTARWILKQPDSGILTAFTNHSTEMLSPTAYDGKTIAQVQWNPVGTGRYKFLDYSADSFVKYQVNPDYFYKLPDGGPAGMVDQIWEMAIPDPVAAATALINGDVQILDESPATQLDLLNGDSHIEGLKKEGFAIRNAYINHGLKPLDNVDFRRALAWAWDPVAQNKLFDNGIGKVATSALTSLSWAHVDVTGFPNFDLDKAKMYITKSGIADADRKVLITGDTLYFQFLQDAWAKIGVKAEYV